MLIHIFCKKKEKEKKVFWMVYSKFRTNTNPNPDPNEQTKIVFILLGSGNMAA